MNVRPPIGTVESPVARLLLLRPVSVKDKGLRREPVAALGALDAQRLLQGEQAGPTQAVRAAKAAVGHAKRHADRFERSRRWFLAATQQGGTETLGVGASDQPGGFHVLGQDLGGLELVELVGGALGAEDLQPLAGAVDLVEGKVHQHVVEDLREAEAELAAQQEAADATALEDRLVEGAAAVGVRLGEDGLR